VPAERLPRRVIGVRGVTRKSQQPSTPQRAAAHRRRAARQPVQQALDLTSNLHTIALLSPSRDPSERASLAEAVSEKFGELVLTAHLVTCDHTRHTFIGIADRVCVSVSAWREEAQERAS
jgi:phosphohistidine phosphatase SixA